MKLLLPIFIVLFLISNSVLAQVEIIGITSNLSKDTLWQTPKVFFDKPPTYINVLIKNSKSDTLLVRLNNSVSEDWQNIGSVNQVLFYNLSGNDYQIQLKSKNTNPDKISTFQFTIAKPFWQQWWFVPVFLLYIILVLALVFYVFFKYKLRQETKLQRVRAMIAADLHDDVGATLTSIKMYGEYIKSAIIKYPESEKLISVLDKLTSSSKDTIEVMRSLVWSINPQNQNNSSFINQLKTISDDLLKIQGIEVEFEWEDINISKLHILMQRNLLLICKEILNNIAKHSKAKKVLIGAQMKSENTILICIKDDGIGFDTGILNKSNGLRNLNRRASEMNAKLELVSKIGNGTTITVELPLDNNFFIKLENR